MSFSDLLFLSIMTLATTGSDGEPHAADVYFAADEELRFYFFSDPLSQHGVDIAWSPRAAVTIHPESQGWEDIRGLQMRGEVKRIEPGSAWDGAWEKYVAKFPFVAGLKAVVDRNQLFVFVPHWIRLVDNRRGFGFKEEWIRRVEGQSEVPGSAWWRYRSETELPGDISG
jgi:uncharacterized protein YhbP (UPF0306 family)